MLSRFVAILLAFAPTCWAATYECANRTELMAALAAHGKGNEYVLTGVTYTGNVLLSYSQSWTASEGAPTIIRAETTGSATITATDTGSAVIQAPDYRDVAWLEFRGINVTNGYDGIRVCGGSHITVRDCYSYDNFNNGIAIHRSYDVLVTGCRMRSNGGSIYAHGLYISHTRITITDCMAWDNAGWGLHLWPYGKDCLMARNIAWNNGSTVDGSPRGCGMVIENGTDSIENATPRVDPRNGNRAFNNICVNNYAYGFQVSRGAWDHLVGNLIINNGEGSVTFSRVSRARVWLHGNTMNGSTAGQSALDVVD